MKEAFYFPHDNNAHNDPKLMTVFMKTWLSWVGLYWILVELLHQQDDWRIKKEEYDQYIKWYTSNENKWSAFVEQVLNIYITSELFLLDNDWFITSRRVLENKKYREELSEKRSLAGKKSALARQKATIVEQNLTSVEQGKERKGNKKKIYSIENNTKIITEHLEKLDNRTTRYKFYKSMLDNIKYIDYEIDTDWIESIENKLLDFKKNIWDDRSKLELENFWLHHSTNKTVMKSVVLRLNTWLNNLLK